MYSVHELVVQILSVLVELLQGADSAAIFSAKAQVLHPVSGRLLREVVGEVGVVHWHVVVGDVVAVGVGEVEGGLRTGAAKAESSHLWCII